MFCRLNKRIFTKTRAFSKRRSYHSDSVFGHKDKIELVYETPEEVLKCRQRESNFYRLVTAYRQHAHKTADVNPVSLAKQISTCPELNPERYGLKTNDRVSYDGILYDPNRSEGSVQDAIEFLQNVYTKSLSAEFLHMEKEEEVEWFSRRFETLAAETMETNAKIRIAKELIKSQTCDNFLATKFSGLKRYGGEGAESMMAFFVDLFERATFDGLEQIVLAIPHRGRLNLLTGMLNFPPAKLFRKLKGLPDFPDKYRATGDVISHSIASVDLSFEGRSLHVTMLYNPSHLEAVNPVSMGKTRAKQLDTQDGDYGERRWSDKILNIQVHGDAAYAGQGIAQECLAISQVPHYEIGGTIHLIVNNQLGFTTPPEWGRSSKYCTDIAKLISAPVLHVNGDFPEMVAKATRMAFEYQRKFRKDVYVDLNCYRQWGHNELDDPTLTNPALYHIIRTRRTVPDLYAEKLIQENLLSKEQIAEIEKTHSAWLNEHLKSADSYIPEDPSFQKQWIGFEQAPEAITVWDTGFDMDLLTTIGTKSVAYPQNFNIHPNLLKTHVKARLSRVAEGVNIDWATAEALAFGSLLYQGFNVRISGQDVGRGTFSHRHVMLVDQISNDIYIPLNHIDLKQHGHLEVANSILSEEAVLGFEYGMSIESPNNLIIWEAQFGDFFNGAQIPIDTFISSGETKWLWSSGLTMLLPHGYDGAGPEHSSSRIERFLQLTDSMEDRVDGDDVNMQVVQPTTPAQYFHLLRRQMMRNFRKPLVVISPKTLLRLSAATSKFSDMAPGTTFLPVVGDTIQDTRNVVKVILCSGKHFYNLREHREFAGIKDTAIVRLECLCPFPALHLQAELDKYPNANVFVWSQEEPRNMGAWSFIKPRFEYLIGQKLKYSGRETLAAPAVGIGSVHQAQAKEVVTKPFSI